MVASSARVEVEFCNPECKPKKESVRTTIIRDGYTDAKGQIRRTTLRKLYLLVMLALTLVGHTTNSW